MSPEEARERFASARCVRLATADAAGKPHIVPLVFALDGDTIYSAVDPKPKRTTDLKRLRNVVANPQVSLLADRYVDDDWDVLWWVRADGTGTVHESLPPRLKAIGTSAPPRPGSVPERRTGLPYLTVPSLAAI